MLLALDTATTTASLALYDLETDRLLAEQTWQARRRQTQQLLPFAQRLLAQLGVEPAQLTAVAVTTGPGSFTGVRIAISVAKGMALGLPASPHLVGIPTLSVTAAPWLTFASCSVDSPAVWPFMQAGRGRYNWTQFPVDQPLHRPDASQHSAGKVEAFVEALSTATTPIWLVGENTPELAEAVAHLEHVHLADAVGGLRRAGHLARLAALHLAAGHEESMEQLRPLYLRTL